LGYVVYALENLLQRVFYQGLKKPVGKRKGEKNMMTDPIADMFSRIRNALMVKKKEVVIEPVSKLKRAILEILKKEGFIEDFVFVENPPGHKFIVKLKYYNGIPAIQGIERVSKPGRRIYVKKNEIPWVKSGLGIAILSTSKGVVTDKEARKLGVGGELIGYIW